MKCFNRGDCRPWTLGDEVTVLSSASVVRSWWCWSFMPLDTVVSSTNSVGLCLEQSIPFRGEGGNIFHKAGTSFSIIEPRQNPDARGLRRSALGSSLKMPAFRCRRVNTAPCSDWTTTREDCIDGPGFIQLPHAGRKMLPALRRDVTQLPPSLGFLT